MVKLVATTHFHLSGIGDLYPGQVFDIGAQHVKVLKALKRATDVSALDDGTLMPTYRTEPMKTEHVHQPPPPTEEEAQTDDTEAPAPEEEEDKETMADAEDSENRQALREHVISALRTRAAALGIDVDGRWGEDRLRREIAAKSDQAGYDRRDMRAQQ